MTGGNRVDSSFKKEKDLIHNFCQYLPELSFLNLSVTEDMRMLSLIFYRKTESCILPENQPIRQYFPANTE